MGRLYQLQEPAFHEGAYRVRGEVVSLRDDERPGPHMRPYEAPKPVEPVTVDERAGLEPVVSDELLHEPQSVLPGKILYVEEPRHRGFLILDTETNGFDDPRLASLALIFADPDLNPECEWQRFVAPDGWTMSGGATKANALTDAHLASVGVGVGEALAAFEVGVMLGRTIVAHHAAFDLRVMRGELRRKLSGVGVVPLMKICTMLEARRLVGNGKLADVYEALTGEPLIGAHDAMVDARACLRVLQELRKRGLNLAAAEKRESIEEIA